MSDIYNDDSENPEINQEPTDVVGGEATVPDIPEVEDKRRLTVKEKRIRNEKAIVEANAFVKESEIAEEDKEYELKQFLIREDVTAPVAKLIELHQKGLGVKAIAKLCNVQPAVVQRKLEPFRGKLDNLKTFKKNKGDYLRLIQMYILDSFTPEEIQTMKAKDRGILFGILADKEKLEESKSANSVNIHFNFLTGYAKRIEEVEIQPEEVIDAEFSKP